MPLRHGSDYKQALSTLKRLQREAGGEPQVPTYSHKHQHSRARSSFSTMWNWQGLLLDSLSFRKSRRRCTKYWVTGATCCLLYLARFFGKKLSRIQFVLLQIDRLQLTSVYCNRRVCVDHPVHSDYKFTSELQNPERNLFSVLRLRGETEHDTNDNVTTKTENTCNSAHLNTVSAQFSCLSGSCWHDSHIVSLGSRVLRMSSHPRMKCAGLGRPWVLHSLLFLIFSFIPDLLHFLPHFFHFLEGRSNTASFAWKEMGSIADSYLLTFSRHHEPTQTRWYIMKCTQQFCDKDWKTRWCAQVLHMVGGVGKVSSWKRWAQVAVPFHESRGKFLNVPRFNLKFCRLKLFQETGFPGDLEDSKYTSGGSFCVFGSHTFVSISWMCKKQSSVSHSSTESEIISLDARLRSDGLPALDLWDLIVLVLGNTTQNHDRTGQPVVCPHTIHTRNQSQRLINDLDNVDFVPKNVQSSHQ